MGRAYLCFLSVCQVLAAAENLSETGRSSFTAAFSEGRLSPSFQNGRLVSIVFETAVASADNVFVYAKSGALTASYALSPTDAIKIRLWDVAVGPSGTVAGVGQAVDREGRLAMFLAIVPSGKKQPLIHQMNPFTGERVAVAADGSVWITAGRTDDGGGDDVSNGEYNVVRHFSPDGKLLDQLVPRSTLRGVQPASGSGGTNMTWIRANGARVGVYFGSSRRWMELNGPKVAACSSIADPLRAGEPPIALTGLVLPAIGGPVALFEHRSGHGLYQLDCNKNSWLPLALYVSTDATAATDLVGVEGNHLVFRGPQAPPTTVIWAPVPSSAQ